MQRKRKEGKKAVYDRQRKVREEEDGRKEGLGKLCPRMTAREGAGQKEKGGKGGRR